MFGQRPGYCIAHGKLRFARTETRDMLRQPAASSENFLALKGSRHGRGWAHLEIKRDSTPMQTINCSAIVLAGGRSSRLGGRDKALETLAGRPLIAHVLERLQPQVDDIVINCNRHQEELAGFGHLLVGDETADFPGPLAGIAAAIPHCQHDLILVTPCDTPWLPKDLYQRLAAKMQPACRLVMAHDSQRLQPLFMLLRRELLASLNANLARGHYKVEAWCREQQAEIAIFDNAAAFANLNTEDELKAARNTEDKNRGEKDSSAF
ncbi:MAG: molybdenum cofactor guanylyltransferase MobA [Moraxellaceae bacterium]